MSRASHTVVAIGFRSRSHAEEMIRSALTECCNVVFTRTIQSSQLSGARALIAGPEADLSSDGFVRAARDAVSRGANLILVLAPDAEITPALEKLIGVRPLDTKPEGEWFFKTKSSLALTARLSPEFSAMGRPTSLELHDDTEALLVTNIEFKDNVTAALKRAPRSFILTLGLEPESRWSSVEIEALIRRAALSDVGSTLETASSELGVAIIGYGPYGGMGTYHGTAVSEVPGLNLVAVADHDSQRRETAKTEFPGIRTYGGYEEVAIDEEIDVCIVATPPVNHAEISMALLDAGKHVISEKPMCLTSREAAQLIARSRSREKMLSVNQSRRWDRDFRAVANALAKGRIGSVFNIETFVGGFEHPCRAWHSEKKVSGGAVYDWGSHHVDWIIQLYGSAPDRVSATQHKRVWHDVTNADQVRVHMLWEDGREAEFFQSDVSAIRRPKFFIQGTSGTITGSYRPLVEETVSVPFGYQERNYHFAEAPATLKLSRYESGYGLVEETLPAAKPMRFAFHKNVADHLLLGEPLAVTPEAAAQVVATLEAAQRSAASNSRYVALDEVE